MILSISPLALAVVGAVLLLGFVVAADEVSVSLTRTRVASVSPNMASFSFEVSGVCEMIGKHPNPPKASFVQLFKNLQEKTGSEGPTIRIGGNSADGTLKCFTETNESWWLILELVHAFRLRARHCLFIACYIIAPSCT
eukprot:m.107526 g.107526  ORF g.107526 m.107526 type:complete len:139 (-) comp15191_c0_seq2:1338-1754(-)